jgi:hypothetical protein
MSTHIETEQYDGTLDLSTARHGAAHVVAHVHLGVTFGSVGLNAAGWCEISAPEWGVDVVANARIALAGPCMDLAVDLIEDADEVEYPIALSWFESWRDDVVSGDGGYRDDMLAADGCVANEAAWALAFCRANLDLIDEAASMLMKAHTNVDFPILAARLHGRTKGVDTAALELADADLIGGWQSLEAVDDAVREYLSRRGISE